MTEIPSTTTSRVMLQLASLQMVSTIAFATTLYICFTAYAGISALLGGAVAALANVYMAFKVRKPIIVTESEVEKNELVPATIMLQRFYGFEVSKFVLTLAMFVISIVVIKVSLLPFIIAYLVAALIVTWLSLLVLDQ